MEKLESWSAHGGVQSVWRHNSHACACPMTFAVFVPPHAKGTTLPVLWFLSGLTCTHANVMEKGEYRAAAAEHGVIVVAPDTSPRGEGVPDDPGSWSLGCGAGFYVDATQAPWAAHYRMYSYLAEELPELMAREFPVDMERQAITGHSMGGHGALILALKNPGRFRAVSAIAPIVQPSTAAWSRPAFQQYLGRDETVWRAWDATALIADGHRLAEVLVDQGGADRFLEDGLRPWLLEEACKSAGIPLELRMHEGYDHSYYFISTVLHEHVAWHSRRLR